MGVAINIAIHELNATRITIAHRPETISMADRIINLDDLASPNR